MKKAKIKTKLSVFLGITVLLLSAGCEKATIKPGELDPDQVISFSADIQPVFSNNCVSCHPKTLNPDLTEGNSYNALIEGGYINTQTPVESELYETILNSGHDPRTSALEKQMILQWIQQGAENN